MSRAVDGAALVLLCSFPLPFVEFQAARSPHRGPPRCRFSRAVHYLPRPALPSLEAARKHLAVSLLPEGSLVFRGVSLLRHVILVGYASAA